MYRILAIILFLGISFQSTVKLGILAWYEVNKTYVATELCENKDKPELNCCGKCYVGKQLKKVDEHSGEKQMPGKNTKTETVEYIIPFTTPAHNTTSLQQEAKVYNGRYTCSKGFDVINSVFHPPPHIG